MTEIGILFSAFACGYYACAVVYIFIGVRRIRRDRAEIAAGLEEIQQHRAAVREALALWNYGAHDEAIEILREEGYAPKQTLDAE